jgi:membrane protein implicated in regulation of membrane protease activity
MSNTLKLPDARETEGDRAPVPAPFLASHAPFRLRWRDDSTLEITHHPYVRGAGWTLCAIGSPFLALGGFLILLAANQGAMGVLAFALAPLLLGILLVSFGCGVLGPRISISRSNGEVIIRRPLRTRTLSISRIAAVQVVETSFHRKRGKYGKVHKIPSHQLNVVVDDAAEPRVFLAFNEDIGDMALKAHAVARHLNVRLDAPRDVKAWIESCESRVFADDLAAAMHRFEWLWPVRDAELAEPFASWIDSSRLLPNDVRLTPRTVDPFNDFLLFLVLGGLFWGFGSILVWLGFDAISAGEWQPMVFLGAVFAILSIVPVILLRRVVSAFFAWGEMKRGELRQGVYIGPAGVVLRLRRNQCYVIALERFVLARVERHAPDSPTLFIVETLDGRAMYSIDDVSLSPELFNRWVDDVRRR